MAQGQEMLWKMRFDEFLDMPRQCFEDVIGFKSSQLEKEFSKKNPSSASRYWKTSRIFSKNPDMQILDDDALHDVMFSCQLGLSLSQLSNLNRLSKSLLKRLRKDKDGFDSTAFEPQVLSYLINTGHEDAQFTNDHGIPDIHIPESGIWLECKKLHSQETGIKYLQAIEQNYRKGCQQISKVGSGMIIIEVDNRNSMLIKSIKEQIHNIWRNEQIANHVLAAVITYWDRKPLYEVHAPQGKGQIYQVRRHAVKVIRTATLSNRIPRFDGETFEFIDTPPIRQVRFSTVARNDDWLKLTRASVSGKNFVGDSWCTWGPAQTTK